MNDFQRKFRIWCNGRKILRAAEEVRELRGAYFIAGSRANNGCGYVPELHKAADQAKARLAEGIAKVAALRMGEKG